ncbi:MAG TPA: hypothetical protein VGE04_13555 [Chloroflexia bacterium]|jgi:hypothetical protein
MGLIGLVGREGLRGRWPLYGLLLLVTLGGLLSGCAEVLSNSPAPRPDVITNGLGATRREWEHEHKVTSPFTGELKPNRLRGLIYDGAYRVTYWVDGPQEVAPASARISRIEFDTVERDAEVLRSLAREMLPDDATLSDFHWTSNGSGSFTEQYSCPSFSRIYEHLAYTDNSLSDWQWSRANVLYSTSTPNIVIQIDPLSGVPPEGWPPVAVPTLSVPLTPVEYR